ncbi:MAG: hypothetical protein N2053_03885 [Chitinispirillaceae bacterium]|nr:hypothetical protein [Chitinispirillaceae bacterium]
MMKKKFAIIFLLSLKIFAEPIIIKGNYIPALLGIPLKNLRLCKTNFEPIPFQIDELTEDGEYICNNGTEPNENDGNGCLDSLDEIVFLREDCSICKSDSDTSLIPFQKNNCFYYPLLIDTGTEKRRIYITNDTTIRLSSKSYICYDNRKEFLKTPFYYAYFSKDRFHFTAAGIVELNGKEWIELTKELRVEILLKALWGLLPIRYTEDNLICYVKRYKTGPIRLIRRGDFHLRMGLGVKGSRAAVYQICYPQMVRVPVFVHIPFRFRTLFTDAWLEMTPIIRKDRKDYYFTIPRYSVKLKIEDKNEVDTLLNITPDKILYTITDKRENGVGWLLYTNLPQNSFEKSGFVLRIPSKRDGLAECGYRLVINDVPRGHYDITNWVLFPNGDIEKIKKAIRSITHKIEIRSNNTIGYNLLSNSVIIKEKYLHKK